MVIFISTVTVFAEYFMINGCTLSTIILIDKHQTVLYQDQRQNKQSVKSFWFLQFVIMKRPPSHTVLPTQGIMGTLIIPLYSLSNQPIYWDKTKRERKMITLFHPHPCLINLSPPDKQANGSVGGCTNTRQMINFWWHAAKIPSSHRSQLSFICVTVCKCYQINPVSLTWPRKTRRPSKFRTQITHADSLLAKTQPPSIQSVL